MRDSWNCCSTRVSKLYSAIVGREQIMMKRWYDARALPLERRFGDGFLWIWCYNKYIKCSHACGYGVSRGHGHLCSKRIAIKMLRVPHASRRYDVTLGCPTCAAYQQPRNDRRARANNNTCGARTWALTGESDAAREYADNDVRSIYVLQKCTDASDVPIRRLRPCNESDCKTRRTLNNVTVAICRDAIHWFSETRRVCLPNVVHGQW